MQYLNFILDPKNDFLGETIEYFKLCSLSIAVAIVIGVVLGALVSRNAILAFIAVNLSGLMRAIPIIAILIVFVPFLGLGFEPTDRETEKLGSMNVTAGNPRPPGNPAAASAARAAVGSYAGR